MSIRPILTAFRATAAIFASAGSAAHGATEIVKPRWRELVRTARREPSRQPEREQN